MPAIDRWLIVGTRRWARIIASELCQLVPSAATIQVKGDVDTVGPVRWWTTPPFAGRVEFVDRFEHCPTLNTGVAIVVNSAYRHRSAIESALSAGYNVVGEKPLTMSHDESREVLQFAGRLGLNVFSTNTYLFADYLRLLREGWLVKSKFSEIHLTWADPHAEVRYGEPKAYDSTVPVVFDVLPHIAGIILATHGEMVPRRSELTVRNGGSSATARFVCDDVVIEASMERHASRRARRARFSGERSEVTIDFSEEPGTVVANRSTPMSADPEWHDKRRPVAEMLRSVYAYFQDGVTDERLDPRAALLGNELIDSVAESYVQQQLTFLAIQGGGNPDDMAYAVKEVKALRERALPFLAQQSPLRRLAMQGRSS